MLQLPVTQEKRINKKRKRGRETEMKRDGKKQRASKAKIENNSEFFPKMF